MCYVRGCEDGEVVLYSYGRSSGFCVDPIEKKPLNHFLPGSSVLSFGTAGCNLACKFCQNWDMSKSREMDTLADTAMPETLAVTAQQLACDSVAFTYNDPIIFLEYAIDTAQACRERGVRSVAVSAGYIDDKPREVFFNEMDAANIDLKSFNADFYRSLCGGELNNVLDTLRYIRHETNTWLEITTLLIPGQNDSASELHQLSEWVFDHLGPDVPLHFTAFHPDWKMRDIPSTPMATLQTARGIALSKGLHYVYTGNVHDTQGSSTYCPGCGARVIERDWYQLGEWAIALKDEATHQASCCHCGHLIAGVFASQPGDWGSRRMPVRLATSNPR
ncbi:AmmeMemoRadiSam system radical SAM enzyme [Aurantivibrio plasticivorans]